MKLALRTQQIIAAESETVNSVDPLGGSYVVESLTNRLEEGALDLFRKLDGLGGMVSAIERGFPQREILDASQRYQREIERQERSIVGVTTHREEDVRSIPILKIGPEVEQEQVARLSDLRKSRDPFKMAGSLEELQEMASLNPKTKKELQEESLIDQFLSGDDTAASGATGAHRH